jgi:cysteine desulfurase
MRRRKRLKRDMALYLDNNGTTTPDPAVVEAMLPWLRDWHANPHAEHAAGRRAAAAVESARDAIAALIGADAEDIYLTSGATESNNLVLQGVLGRGNTHRRLLMSSIEHKSVLAIGAALADSGVDVTVLEVESSGRLTPERVSKAIDANPTDGITVVALMHANNEIGTIQPVREIAALLKGTGAMLHVDAAQTCGKLPIDVEALGVDFMTISAHKMYGPAGIGAIYIAPGLRGVIRPLMFGGAQQDAIRPGTIPVFLAVGFGMASTLAQERLDASARHLNHCTAACVGRLTELGIDHELLGDPHNRLPGLISLRLPRIDADGLLLSLSRELYASTGSACTSGEIRTSHVYRAIGLSEEEGAQVIRLGFSRNSAVPDGARAAELIAGAIHRVAA